MHAGDQRILGQDKVLARRRHDQRRIILQPKRSRPGKGCKVAGDQGIFGDHVGKPVAVAGRGLSLQAISSARTSRAMRSSTALVMPGSSPS